MKKRFVIIAILITISVGYFLNFGKSITYFAGNDNDDEVHEWNSMMLVYSYGH